LHQLWAYNQHSIKVLNNIDFTYPHTGIQAIKNFTLHINPGAKIAIIGKTGSGKSTIAQLLLRMYDVDRGSILYDEIPISKIDTTYLRSNISYVPQDIFLFSETIENNIAFGVDKATKTDILQASQQANIAYEIEKFPEGYKTMIGERGVTLSGGQKQRISIARALIKNPSIVIFDDCLSAVDAKTEKTVLDNLSVYLKNRTAIIITHRIFSLFDFDKIIVLDEGRIVEQGNHLSLLQQNGYYAEMYVRQQQLEHS
jgi:ATP-binding cassette, subfamily B, multidrug efflux pump